MKLPPSLPASGKDGGRGARQRKSNLWPVDAVPRQPDLPAQLIPAAWDRRGSGAALGFSLKPEKPGAAAEVEGKRGGSE